MSLSPTGLHHHHHPRSEALVVRPARQSSGPGAEVGNRTVRASSCGHIVVRSPVKVMSSGIKNKSTSCAARRLSVMPSKDQVQVRTSRAVIATAPQPSPHPRQCEGSAIIETTTGNYNNNCGSEAGSSKTCIDELNLSAVAASEATLIKTQDLSVTSLAGQVVPPQDHQQSPAAVNDSTQEQQAQPGTIGPPSTAPGLAAAFSIEETSQTTPQATWCLLDESALDATVVDQAGVTMPSCPGTGTGELTLEQQMLQLERRKKENAICMAAMRQRLLELRSSNGLPSPERAVSAPVVPDQVMLQQPEETVLDQPVDCPLTLEREATMGQESTMSTCNWSPFCALLTAARHLTSRLARERLDDLVRRAFGAWRAFSQPVSHRSLSGWALKRWRRLELLGFTWTAWRADFFLRQLQRARAVYTSRASYALADAEEAETLLLAAGDPGASTILDHHHLVPDREQEEDVGRRDSVGKRRRGDQKDCRGASPRFEADKLRLVLLLWWGDSRGLLGPTRLWPTLCENARKRRGLAWRALHIWQCGIGSSHQQHHRRISGPASTSSNLRSIPEEAQTG